MTKATQNGGKLDMKRWAEELAALQKSVATGRHSLSIETTLSEDREDRFEPSAEKSQFVPHHGE